MENKNALDMSQYSILGDETYTLDSYTLDSISKIDIITPRGIENSMYMKKYRESQRQCGKSNMNNNLVLSYIDYIEDLKSRSIEPVMSFDEYVTSMSSYVKEIWGMITTELKDISEIYNRSLPVKNKFVFILPGDKILIISRGRLLAYTLPIFDSVYQGSYIIPTMLLDVSDYILTRYLADQLRERIKIKRIKKR